MLLQKPCCTGLEPGPVAEFGARRASPAETYPRLLCVKLWISLGLRLESLMGLGTASVAQLLIRHRLRTGARVPSRPNQPTNALIRGSLLKLSPSSVGGVVDKRCRNERSPDALRAAVLCSFYDQCSNAQLMVRSCQRGSALGCHCSSICTRASGESLRCSIVRCGALTKPSATRWSRKWLSLS